MIIWDIADEMKNPVLSHSISPHHSIGAHYSQMIFSSILEIVLTSKNSTHVSSSLEVYGIQPLIGYHVTCDNEKIVISRRNISK